MPKAKRKNGDLPDLESHPYLCKKLVDIVYNPELPVNYHFLAEGKKLYVLQMLYLALNPSFQTEFGKQLEEWIARAEADAKEIDSETINNTDYTKCKPTVEDFIKKEMERGYTGTYIIGKTFFIPSELCIILLRSEIDYIHLLQDEVMYEMLDTNGTWDDSLFAEFNKIASYNFGSVFESRRTDKFQEFVKARVENRVPHRVYAAIDISKPKETIMEAFGKFICSMQELYFQQNPDLKHPVYGHKEYKSDGREKTYPFDELERYFTAYVHYARGMMQKDIAKMLFPNDDEESRKSKINQDIRKANNIIENACSGDFPGKY